MNDLSQRPHCMWLSFSKNGIRDSNQISTTAPIFSRYNYFRQHIWAEYLVQSHFQYIFRGPRWLQHIYYPDSRFWLWLIILCTVMEHVLFQTSSIPEWLSHWWGFSTVWMSKWAMLNHFLALCICVAFVHCEWLMIMCAFRFAAQVNNYFHRDTHSQWNRCWTVR